jgi:hypothetical protein
MLIQHEHGLAGVFLTATHIHLFMKGGLLPVTLAFVFSLAFHYGFARFLHFRFKFWPFVAYYFVYAPLWILISLAFWVELAVQRHMDVDWKI